jgi:hypothetical protein
MARSIGTAVISNGHLLSGSWFLEDIAARDGEIAYQLNRGIETPVAEHSKGLIEMLDNKILKKLRVLYVSGFDNSPLDNDNKKL